MSDVNSSQDSSSTVSLAPDGSLLTATGTGGVTVIINWALLVFEVVPEQHLSATLGMTPVIGAMIAAAVSYFWRGYGKDPERLEREQILKSRIKQCKKDIKDKILSEDEREHARRDYVVLKEILRKMDIDK